MNHDWDSLVKSGCVSRRCEKEGCMLNLGDLRNMTIDIGDCDCVSKLRQETGKKSDCIVFWEIPPELVVSVVECKGGEDRVRRVRQQLNAGAVMAEALRDVRPCKLR